MLLLNPLASAHTSRPSFEHPAGQQPDFSRRAVVVAVGLLLSICAALSHAAPAAPNPATHPKPTAGPLAQAQSRFSEPNMLVLELQLDGMRLSDAFIAYEVGDDVLLPVGELARLLTLGVTVDAPTRTATGFLLQENRPFRLELDAARVLLPSHGSVPEAVDPALLRWIDDDLYVASRLLQSWWPLDLVLNLSSLNLKVQPRETLPIQARLAREKAAKNLRGRAGMDAQDMGYPWAERDYSFFSTPFVDQTLGVQVSRSGSGGTTTDLAYSAFLTGDLLGAEAALYLGATQDNPQPDARLTLSRHDPEPRLLGPLGARSVALGSVSMPSLNHVMRAAAGGNGLVLSNRPLNQPSSYGVHRLRGDLPPGWDVTLYFNEALIGFRQARSDGLYEFDDQELVFGRNEFRLVFNGPLGQTRVEREVFLLDQTLTQPGELYYTAGAHRADDHSTRQTVQLDMGLAEHLAATVGLVGVKRQPSSTTTTTEPPRTYANLGLRASVAGMLLNADLARAKGGGHMHELAVRTSLGSLSVDATHTRLNNFVSDFFSASSDPLRTRDRARFSGTLPLLGTGLRLPLGLDVFREVTESGRRSLNAQARLSLNLDATNFTQSFSWQSSGGQKSASGTLQVSRRVAGIGLSSQLAYTIKPTAALSSWALSADKSLNDASRLNAGLVRSFSGNQTTWTAGYNRNFGSFGLGVTGRYGNNGERGMGVQLFMALGHDPRSDRWVRDWQPMAGSGVVSARAFIDENMNSRFDDGEQPLQGVGFLLGGGGRHPARTDANGLAYMSRLTPKAYADVGLDAGTLEDPQWQPLVAGVRVLPRPGKVHELDFPVVMTGEVDGTVYLLTAGKSRGIGNAEVELLDPQGVVVVKTLSSNDGFYILPAIKPGVYTVRISPAQLEKLGLATPDPVELRMRGDGEFVNGLDFVLRKKP